jgi:hypothetical protein
MQALIKGPIVRCDRRMIGFAQNFAQATPELRKYKEKAREKNKT